MTDGVFVGAFVGVRTSSGISVAFVDCEQPALRRLEIVKTMIVFLKVEGKCIGMENVN